MTKPLNIVIIGLSVSSSWGNGHATTYRALMRALAERGHDVLFLERDVPWYAENRDLPNLRFGTMKLYHSVDELRRKFARNVRDADLIIVGSYVPDGVVIGEWVTQTAKGIKAFYDIDTPVTLAKLASGDNAYITPDLIPSYDLYLSFTGGPILRTIEREYGAPNARALYCSVDPHLYFPEAMERRWDLGYMGTYSEDRQMSLELLLLDAARHNDEAEMIVAGPMYPADIEWPSNVKYISHVAPDEHRRFYNSQRFTLNLTRSDMIQAGYSPSVRLFEAAACATPIITDYWEGLETFFEVGAEILVASNSREVLSYLNNISDADRITIGQRARARVLSAHTANDRARELEQYVEEVTQPRPRVVQTTTMARAIA